MSYPNYGTPGNPIMDPYYMTAEEEAHAFALAEYDRGISEGTKAYKAGLPVTACPYPRKTDPLREGWLDGWDH